MRTSENSVKAMFAECTLQGGAGGDGLQCAGPYKPRHKPREP
jgi:hypothetical protein